MFSNLKINKFFKIKSLLKFECIKIEPKVFSQTISTACNNTRAVHHMCGHGLGDCGSSAVMVEMSCLLIKPVFFVTVCHGT